MRRWWLAAGVVAVLNASSCASDDEIASRPTALPLVLAPPIYVAEADPTTTMHEGRRVHVIQEVCATVQTSCSALTFGGGVYVREGWALNERAVQALGEVLGVSEDGAVVRALFTIDTIVGYRSSPDAEWQALVASTATHEPPDVWLLCSALTSIDPAWITCDGIDLAAAGLRKHWRGRGEQILAAGCDELPRILGDLAVHSIGAGSDDESSYYAVVALVDARWIELGCGGHLRSVLG